MVIEDNVKSYLEYNVDKNRQELIRGLKNIFDYNYVLALKIYSAWRNEYKLADYKLIEESFSEKEVEMLKKLDKMYKEEMQRVQWW